MIRKVIIDEFFNNQPERTFENDLKKYEVPVLNRIKRNDNENLIEIKSVSLDLGDFKNNVNLKTSVYNFELFVEKNSLLGKGYKVAVKKDNSFDKETFKIKVLKDKCIIFAGETEGVRRAIIYFEDILLTGNGYLTLGEILIKSKIKNRLARCFFAPINRPPKNLAELNDDIDYYPDAYLDRLMRDGVNSVWVYSDFDALVKSSYIKEFGNGSEERVAKLNSIIDKCARYGIKVYLFTIAPMSLNEFSLNKKYPDIAKKYPQVNGNNSRGPSGFCTYTEFGEGYLREAVEGLVKSAPKLGGIISITFGERVTHCGNTWPDLDGGWKNTCPHCADKSRMEIVTHTADIIKSSIDKINPNVEFISWTYAHRGQPFEVIKEYVEKCPENVIMLQNFEDDGRVEQLGKKRFALDYYLCYAGPSDMFAFTAKEAVKLNKQIYAKMQVCCSHELASVPYIPVPGIIYDKLVRAKNLGVTGVMESWLFGNYPCLMTKAVGLLSTNEEFASKRDFLLKLAGIYWKNIDVEKVVSAWEYFEKAYKLYPINVMFNYYGPMHDGVVWELSLIPKNFSLPRTWQTIDKTDGDRIGECLFAGHTIEEAITLCKDLCDNWSKGLNLLSETSAFNADFNEQISVAKALNILFKCGYNILLFYKLRDDLGYGVGESDKTLNKIKNIVLEEIKNSEEMIILCQNDNRLGYHSEAEGYKFFPEKIKNRIVSLNRLLENELPIVEQRIKSGQSALSYYDGDDDSVKSLYADKNCLSSAEWAYLDDGISKFRMAVNDKIEIEIFSEKEQNFCINTEFRLMFPDATMVVKSNGDLKMSIEAKSHQSVLDEKIEEEQNKWKVTCLSNSGNTHLLLSADKDKTNFVRLPFKFLIKTFDGASWCVDPMPCYTLGKDSLSPGDFGWIK